MEEYRDNEDEGLTATEAVLTNQDLMDIILSKAKDYKGVGVKRQFSTLRLVSRSFNTAVLNLPHPSPFQLYLGAIFPQLYSGSWCSEQTTRSIPHEDIPTITEQLVRNVVAYMHPDLRIGGDIRANDLGAVTLSNFCSIYGSSIRILNLAWWKEGHLPLLALTIDIFCPNLKELILGINRCTCDENSEPHTFTFSTAKPNLSKLKVRDETFMDVGLFERWQGVCANLYNMVGALVKAATNLESLETNSNMFFNLRDHGMMKHLDVVVYPGKPSVSSEVLMNMLTGPCRTLRSLRLLFDGLTVSDNAGLISAMERDLRLPPFQGLEELHLIVRLSSFNFGPALTSCIFSPATANLHSLTVDALTDSSTEDFLLLIRDNTRGFVNRTVEKLLLKCLTVPIPYLPHFLTAFPNVRAVEMRVRLENPDDDDEMQNLVDVLRTAVCGWKVLEVMNFRLVFPITFEDLQNGLEELGENFWRDGSVRVVRLQFEGWEADPFFPTLNEIGSLEDSLSAMKALEKVTLANLMMPAGLTEALLRYIINNDLPISFFEPEDLSLD